MADCSGAFLSKGSGFIMNIISRSWLHRVFLALCLAGLAGCASGPSKPRYQPGSIAPFAGVWEGQGYVQDGPRRAGALLTFSASEQQARVEFKVDRRTVRAILNPLGMLNGEMHFAVSDVEAKSLTAEQLERFPLGQISVSFPPVDRGSGAEDRGLVLKAFPLLVSEPAKSGPTVMDTMRNLRRKYGNQSPLLNFPTVRPTSNSSKENQAITYRLSRPVILAGRAQRTYGGSGQMFYEDWRNRGKPGETSLFADQATSDARLADDLRKLQSQGYKCLSQLHRDIPAGGTMRIDLQASALSRNLYLVYARIPGPRIIYSVAKQPAGFLNINNGYNYPVVFAETGYSTILSMTTHPADGSLERTADSIPVTIFVMSNTPGDYGQGCRLEDYGLDRVVQFDKKLKVFLKILGAVGLERVRQKSIENESEITAALVASGRNALLESAWRDWDPDVTDEQLAYFGRWVGLLTSRDIMAFAFQEDLKKYIEQKIKSDFPHYPEGARRVTAAFLSELAFSSAGRR